MLSVAHPFKYEQASAPWLLRMWQRLGAARAATRRENLLRKLLLVAAHDLWGWLVLARVLFRFDAFLFVYGQTITNSHFELWLLKKLGKKLIFIYVGSDSRPPYIDGGSFPGEVTDAIPRPEALLAVTRRCKRRLRLHETYGDYLVNSPATAHFHQRPYINWFAMGIPKTLALLLAEAAPRTASVRILHGPSNPLVKGSAIILAVIERLREKGYPIELVKIEGMPNERVLRELAQCDFVVDQLYSDTPLAAFATEAAFFAKPAVVGGYFASQVADYLAADDIPPSLFVPPEELEAAVERLIRDPALRRELGEKARQFVATRWSTRAVAERYWRLLNDDVPDHWWCDPRAVRYVEGCGMPRGRAQRLIGALVDRFGAQALQVSDKPELEAALVALAAGRSAGGADA